MLLTSSDDKINDTFGQAPQERRRDDSIAGLLLKQVDYYSRRQRDHSINGEHDDNDASDDCQAGHCEEHTIFKVIKVDWKRWWAQTYLKEFCGNFVEHDG